MSRTLKEPLLLVWSRKELHENLGGGVHSPIELRLGCGIFRIGDEREDLSVRQVLIQNI